MDRGSPEYNTDTYSDSDDTVLPHTPPDTSTWEQLIGAANMTKQFMMWQGEEEAGTPYKYSIPNGLFMLCFAAVFTLLMKIDHY